MSLYNDCKADQPERKAELEKIDTKDTIALIR